MTQKSRIPTTEDWEYHLKLASAATQARELYGEESVQYRDAHRIVSENLQRLRERYHGVDPK